MALLTILEFPDPRLRTRAAPVRVFDATLEQLVGDMLETMYAANGIGLAATQIDVHRRLLVMDPSAEKNQPQLYVNPEIVLRDGAAIAEEGCLSVPETYERVPRSARIRVRAQDQSGRVFERELEGLDAVCLQHECDHLSGKLFVDYLSFFKRFRIRHRLQRQRRDRAARAAPQIPVPTGPVPTEPVSIE
jgi:peptide deformylase